MVSEKLIKRIEKLRSGNEEEMKITKRYIDTKDTVFDVATYITENVDSSFFVIECELKYRETRWDGNINRYYPVAECDDIFLHFNHYDQVYNYSFEVQTTKGNIVTGYNFKEDMKQKILSNNILTDVGYNNNIQIENRIIKITIQK